MVRREFGGQNLVVRLVVRIWWSEFGGQEDVKKLICLSFRDFIFDPKCLQLLQRSLTRHPRAIFLTPSSPQILKSIFSHPPDGTETYRIERFYGSKVSSP